MNNSNIDNTNNNNFDSNDNDSNEKTIITLTSNDNENFEIEKDIALLSETIKNMYEDNNENSLPIPLPNVNSKILSKVIEYMKYYKTTKNNDEENDQWLKSYINLDDETLFNIILAANYLDIKSLLDITCKAVADEIKSCKTPEEIRKRFNIKNDFTPEEEEEVRRENAWIDDR